MNEIEAAKRIKEFGLHHAIQDLPNSQLTVQAFEIGISALIEKSKYKQPSWIKVDAEHMPPDMDSVMATMRKEDGSNHFIPQCRWSKEDNAWQWLYEAGVDYWQNIDYPITHWMPYPEPAQD